MISCACFLVENYRMRQIISQGPLWRDYRTRTFFADNNLDSSLETAKNKLNNNLQYTITNGIMK